jgi:phosphoribosylglycinamide formyltransferase-1
MNASVQPESLRLAVFASTRGTDLQAILDSVSIGELPFVDLRIVLSDREDSYALVRAEKAGIPVRFLNPKGMKRSEFDARCLEVCREMEVDFIFLIGYMRIISSTLIDAYRGRIFNIHPSLLPKYPGMDLNVHEEVIRNGEQESGCTLHHVSEELDGGEIFLQEKVPVSPGETAESLKEKVQQAEQKVLLQSLFILAKNLGIISDLR